MGDKIKPTFGPLYEVACPWCQGELDFTDVDGQFAAHGFGGSSVGSMLKAGGLSSKESPHVECEHCGKFCVITGVFRDPIIAVESVNKKNQVIRASFFITNVKCALCGKHNNLKDAYKQVSGYSDTYAALEDDERIEDPIVGTRFTCDHCQELKEKLLKQGVHPDDPRIKQLDHKDKILSINKVPHLRLTPAEKRPNGNA